VEAQLGDRVSARERRRRLIHAWEMICYYQRRNAEARHFHTKTRKRLLRRLGIDLRTLRRCPLVI